MPDLNSSTEDFDNPQIQREYAGYALHGDVAAMRDLLEKCDNPVALAEAAAQIEEVSRELSLLAARVHAKITRLYFPAPLVA